MKDDNRLLVFLIIFAIILGGYVVYKKFLADDYIIIERGPKGDSISLIQTINYDNVKVYLMSDGNAIVSPLNNNEIDALSDGENLKDRLKVLYDKSTYTDYYNKENRIKGYLVKLDDKIEKMYKVKVNKMDYVVLLKSNNKIGLFDYDSYYNLMYTEVKDNYNNIENVLKVENNELYYLDGSKIKLEKIL